MAFKLFRVSDRLLQSERTQTIADADLEAKLAGVTHVVNLWHTADMRIVCSSSRRYLHVSLPDGKLRPELVQSFEDTVCSVVEYARAGGTVLTHCWGGKNRSGLVNALALMRLEGISGEEAYERVRAARRGSLFNEDFARYVRERRPY